jgi:hypothetical protein
MQMPEQQDAPVAHDVPFAVHIEVTQAPATHA